MFVPSNLHSVLSLRRVGDPDHDATPDPKHIEAKVFVAFHIIGGLGNLLMLITALVSRRVNRHVTWINFCVTWLIFAISYTLLFYAGRQFSEEEPSFPLCLTQAGLIYGAPVLGACSTLSLVIQIWLSLRRIMQKDVQGEKPHGRESSLLTILLVLLPYVAWFGTVLGALVVGLHDTSKVMRTNSSVYCVIWTGVPGRVSAGIVAVILATAIIFQGLIAALLYRSWGAYQKLRRMDKNTLSISMVVRMGCFLVLNIITVSQIVVFLAQKTVIANIWISLTPIAAVAVFATQRDILRVWTFRKSPEYY
ncbi:hypothetical protein BDY19DRAFT_666669 [Irpex rosettiformis]|uniref:Uncharacterized protein n=1 Tax=Irpex rosettiformis TaxID=378272 RepID=A0ACB8U9H9_9APHY|nr:hypothetical protein BDY19DRAFT_666669 [Irpex rosettiformis]